MGDLEKRVLELETRYSFLDDLLQKLNEIVVEQQQQIEQNGRINQLLQQRISELNERFDGPGKDSIEERPPHY